MVRLLAARSETIAAALTNVVQVDRLVLLTGSFVAGKVQDAQVDHLHDGVRGWFECCPRCQLN